MTGAQLRGSLGRGIGALEDLILLVEIERLIREAGKGLLRLAGADVHRAPSLVNTGARMAGRNYASLGGRSQRVRITSSPSGSHLEDAVSRLADDAEFTERCLLVSDQK